MTAANNIVPMADVKARLPMTQGARSQGVTPAQWRVLVETTFPTAQTAEAVEMALDYCAARGLDIFKKPVHIVPMWNSALRKSVETVWAGINEIQITAHRTGQFAGMEPAKWGPMVTKTFSGERKNYGKSESFSIELTFPEWCEVVVYRLVAGSPRPFSEQVFWEEAYSTSGGRGSTLPTDMWIKRPRGQLAKVAKAASLRAAFPEEGELTAEEMEGKIIDAGGVVIEHQPTQASQPARPTIEHHASNDEQGEPGEYEEDQPAGPVIDSIYIGKFEAEVAEGLKAINDMEALDAFWKSGISVKVREIGGVDKAAMNRLITRFSQKKNAILKAQEEAGQEGAADAPDASEPEQATDAAEVQDAPLDATQEATLRKVKEDLGVDAEAPAEVRSQRKDEGDEPAKTYTKPPAPAAIEVPNGDDGKPAWNRWAKEALEQLKQAGNGEYGTAWTGKWLALNAANIATLRTVNADWAGRVDKLYTQVKDHLQDLEEAAAAEAMMHFPTVAVEYDGETPNWIAFENNLYRYIRDTPNHRVAQAWWTRHKMIVANMAKAGAINAAGRTGEHAAADLKADLIKFFPQLAD